MRRSGELSLCLSFPNCLYRPFHPTSPWTAHAWKAIPFNVVISRPTALGSNSRQSSQEFLLICWRLHMQEQTGVKFISPTNPVQERHQQIWSGGGLIGRNVEMLPRHSRPFPWASVSTSSLPPGPPLPAWHDPKKRKTRLLGRPGTVPAQFMNNPMTGAIFGPGGLLWYRPIIVGRDIPGSSDRHPDQF